MFDLVRQLLTLRPEDETTNFQNVARLVDFLKDYGTYPPFFEVQQGVNEPECVIDGRPYIMFAANNYLSLSGHPAVKEAAIRAIERYGVGPGGSRVMSGNVEVIVELERRIAAMVGKEDCLTFPTGYMANVTVFQALMGSYLGRLPYETKESVIFIDELIHGSALDGCRLSPAKTVTFGHNDLEDLEARLEEHASMGNKLIVTEGVYCLEGEIVDMPRYVELARAHKAKLMVDDAHAIGVLGRRGGGSPDHHDCADGIDIVMGCMDKAMGGTGGYLCGDKALIDYLRIAANATMLSSALPAAMAGAMIAAVDLMESGQAVREDLAGKAGYLKMGLRDIGYSVLGSHDLPSVPLFIGDENLGIAFAKRMRDLGAFCPIMRWPGVPAGKARFRFSLMAAHERRHLDRLIDICDAVGHEIGLLR